MNKWFIIPLIILVGCGDNDNTPNPMPEPNDTISRFDPVETREPNTTYSPAFEGQTRTYGIRTFTELETEILNTSLIEPWGITQLPDGRFLVTQKAGNLVLLNSLGQVSKTYDDLPTVDATGQGGLLDVVLDKEFSSNRTFYFTYSKRIDEGTMTVLSKARLSDDENSIEGVEILYEAKPAYEGNMHYGGRMILDNDEHIYLGTGERSDMVMRMHAQQTNNGLGKIIRIKTDGSIPLDNPFRLVAGADPYVYSIGHRNVQGLAIDPISNKIYQTELGPKGGDEINIIEPAKNYGWPIITYGLEYSGATIGGGITQQSGMEQPIYYWDPVISPSGMILYNYDFIPEWKGCLIIGALSGKHLVRIRLLDGKVAGEERLLESEGQRFRDVEVGLDGSIFAITDEGRLYRISKK